MQTIVKLTDYDIFLLQEYTPDPCDSKCGPSQRMGCCGCPEHNKWYTEVWKPIKEAGLEDIAKKYAELYAEGKEIANLKNELEAKIAVRDKHISVFMANFDEENKYILEGLFGIETKHNAAKTNALDYLNQAQAGEAQTKTSAEETMHAILILENNRKAMIEVSEIVRRALISCSLDYGWDAKSVPNLYADTIERRLRTDFHESGEWVVQSVVGIDCAINVKYYSKGFMYWIEIKLKDNSETDIRLECKYDSEFIATCSCESDKSRGITEFRTKAELSMLPELNQKLWYMFIGEEDSPEFYRMK